MTIYFHVCFYHPYVQISRNRDTKLSELLGKDKNLLREDIDAKIYHL